jgi:hypothetical protein
MTYLTDEWAEEEVERDDGVGAAGEDGEREEDEG